MAIQECTEGNVLCSTIRANDLFLSLLSFGLNGLFLFVIDSDGSGVNHLGRVLDQKLDLAHTVKFFDSTSSEGTSDLHTVRDD